MNDKPKKARGGKREGSGRPPKEFDHELFEELCQIQCTQSEICSVLKLHSDTLVLKVKQHYLVDYSEAYKRFSEGGKSSLRRYQFNLAKKNTAMGIWLGKQWLGQKESHDLNIPSEVSKQFEECMKMLNSKQVTREPARPALENS